MAALGNCHTALGPFLLHFLMAPQESKEGSVYSIKHLCISDKVLGVKGGLRRDCFLGKAGTLTPAGQAEVCKTPREEG